MHSRLMQPSSIEKQRRPLCDVRERSLGDLVNRDLAPFGQRSVLESLLQLFCARRAESPNEPHHVILIWGALRCERHATRRQRISEKRALTRKQHKGVKTKVFEEVGPEDLPIVNVHELRGGQECQPSPLSEECCGVNHEVKIERRQSAESPSRFEFDETCQFLLPPRGQFVVA